MSRPISQCQQVEAIVSEETYKQLLDSYKQNHIYGGHYTVFSCQCKPNCYDRLGITSEMLVEHNAKVEIEWAEFINNHDKSNCMACNRSGMLSAVGTSGFVGISSASETTK